MCKSACPEMMSHMIEILLSGSVPGFSVSHCLLLSFACTVMTRNRTVARIACRNIIRPCSFPKVLVYLGRLSTTIPVSRLCQLALHIVPYNLSADPADISSSIYYFSAKMIENPIYTLTLYGVSPRRGFLPEQLPLEHLPGAYFHPWEVIVGRLPALIESGQLRSIVDQLPLFDTGRLSTEPEWQRAYVVFSFLTHAYIWGGQRPSEVSCPQTWQSVTCLPNIRKATTFSADNPVSGHR